MKTCLKIPKHLKKSLSGYTLVALGISILSSYAHADVAGGVVGAGATNEAYAHSAGCTAGANSILGGSVEIQHTEIGDSTFANASIGIGGGSAFAQADSMEGIIRVKVSAIGGGCTPDPLTAGPAMPYATIGAGTGASGAAGLTDVLYFDVAENSIGIVKVKFDLHGSLVFDVGAPGEASASARIQSYQPQAGGDVNSTFAEHFDEQGNFVRSISSTYVFNPGINEVFIDAIISASCDGVNTQPSPSNGPFVGGDAYIGNCSADFGNTGRFGVEILSGEISFHSASGFQIAAVPLPNAASLFLLALINMGLFRRCLTNRGR